MINKTQWFYLILIILHFIIACGHGGSIEQSKSLSDPTIKITVASDGTSEFIGKGEFEGVIIRFKDPALAGSTITIKKSTISSFARDSYIILSHVYTITVDGLLGSKVVEGEFIFPNKINTGKNLTLLGNYPEKILDYNAENIPGGVRVSSLILPGEFVLAYRDISPDLPEKKFLFLKSIPYEESIRNSVYASGVNNVAIDDNVLIYIDNSQLTDNISNISWNLLSKPTYSNASLAINDDKQTANLKPDKNGTYEIKVDLTLKNNTTISDSIKIIATNYTSKSPLTYCGICHSGLLVNMKKMDYLGRNKLRDLTTSWSNSKHAKTTGKNSDSCNKCHKTSNSDGVTCEGCHGPSGAFGDGHPETSDRNSRVCITCHNVGENNIDAHSFIYADLHENSYNLTKNSKKECLICHTNEGFLSYMNKIDLNTGYYKGVSCVTCHDPHGENGNPNMLRLFDNITINIKGNKKIINSGKSTLCYYCHGIGFDANGNPISDYDLSSLPHNTQREMLEGIGGIDYGLSLDSSIHKEVENKCVGCHMTILGGSLHSFSMKNDVEKHLNYCNSSCHSYNPNIKVNYVNGHYEVKNKIEEIINLQLQLQNRINQILNRPPNTTISLNYDNPNISAELKTSLKQASYNYYFVKNDRSNGVHNYLYAKGLLEASINDLKKY